MAARMPASCRPDLGLNTYGFGHQKFNGYRIADDFPVDADWAVDTVTFYAYQTNSPSDPSTITAGQPGCLGWIAGRRRLRSSGDDYGVELHDVDTTWIGALPGPSTMT